MLRFCLLIFIYLSVADCHSLPYLKIDEKHDNANIIELNHENHIAHDRSIAERDNEEANPANHETKHRGEDKEENDKEIPENQKITDSSKDETEYEKFIPENPLEADWDNIVAHVKIRNREFCSVMDNTPTNPNAMQTWWYYYCKELENNPKLARKNINLNEIKNALKADDILRVAELEKELLKTKQGYIVEEH